MISREENFGLKVRPVFSDSISEGDQDRVPGIQTAGVRAAHGSQEAGVGGAARPFYGTGRRPAARSQEAQVSPAATSRYFRAPPCL